MDRLQRAFSGHSRVPRRRTFATQRRTGSWASKRWCRLTDVLLVVGSQNSSNSRRLVEVCENEGVPAYLVDDSREVKPEWLEGIQTVAVTAGASAPENLVQELIQSLETQFGFDYHGRDGTQGRRRALPSAF